MKDFKTYILELCAKKEGTEVEFKSARGGFPGSFWEHIRHLLIPVVVLLC